jgi:glucose-1-phosphate thymidylyltransferase
MKKNIKGVILAGGLGSRLAPLTNITNKHLLPIFDKPMIYYPLKILIESGIKDIMIVTGGNNAGDFLRLLGNGSEFGLEDLNYTYQKGEGGIADALKLVKHFVGNSKFCVILGDNIIEKNITSQVDNFLEQENGAKILLKKVPDPQRFGVAEIKDNKVINIVEKPKKPVSDYAVTGIYFYHSDVFDFLKNLKPSNRGELEITDVNNYYINRNQMTYDVLDGWWTDAGTFESLFKANYLVSKQSGIDIKRFNV